MPTKISFNKNIINCMHLLVDVVLVVDVDVLVVLEVVPESKAGESISINMFVTNLQKLFHYS